MTTSNAAGNDRHMKAWRTEAMDVVSLVYANTREQARALPQRQAAEFGYDVQYTDVHATRAAYHDGPIMRTQQRKCLSWIAEPTS